MKTLFTVAYVLHMLAIIGMLVLLLREVSKSPRKLAGGFLHSALTALVAGVAMVGAWSKQHPDEVLNHTKIGVKLIVLLAVLVIGYTNIKKPELKKNAWLTLLGLVVLNILIAGIWK